MGLCPDAPRKAANTPPRFRWDRLRIGCEGRGPHICRGMALVLFYDQMGKLGRYLTSLDNLLNCTSGRKFEMIKFAQFLFWPRDLKPSRVILAFRGHPLNSEYHSGVPHVKVNSILLMIRFPFSHLPYLPI